MESRLPWLIRDNPCYDPNRIGAISEAKIITALVAAGKVVLRVHVGVQPYDLVLDEEEGFLRVQCKTGRLSGGAIVFRPHHLRAARRETGWQRRVRDYRGEVDCFGVYCPETDGVYLVPITAVAGQRSCSLRLTPAKNGQSKGIRWAKDYEVVPLPISPEEIEEAMELG
ncbi:MAG: group I intron-associated PD-(D/E)XK endonuclease [Gemmataceae bacterium]|nr:group I intron-associated PD-(D/E)XK endonuclease [Gemmataceae bacterium]